MRNLLSTRENIKPYLGNYEYKILLIALKSHLANLNKEVRYRFQDRYTVRAHGYRQSSI